MVSNSPNIKKMNNYHQPQIIGHKRKTDLDNNVCLLVRYKLKSRSEEPLLLVACLIGQLMRIIDYEYKKTIAGKKNYFRGWSFTPEID